MVIITDPITLADLKALTASVEQKFTTVKRAEHITTPVGFGSFINPPTEQLPVQQYNIAQELRWEFIGAAKAATTERATAANIREECLRLIDLAAAQDSMTQYAGAMLFWRQAPRFDYRVDLYNREINILLSARGYVVTKQ